MLLHTPVMLKEVCEYLPQNTQLIVDCTLGHGGHAIALLSIAKEAKLIGFDVDELMMTKARLQLATKIDENGQKLFDIDKRVEFVRGNYADIVSVLA
jgi:16S rRNA C1402 N4-methylase RsmH